jgi:hypothetical protein
MVHGYGRHEHLDQRSKMMEQQKALERLETATEFVGTDEEVLVQEWRTAQLERLGISSILAQAFASVVDWHEVARLIERGCSSELALEIVR